jgi:hypothetical protein
MTDLFNPELNLSSHTLAQVQINSGTPLESSVDRGRFRFDRTGLIVEIRFREPRKSHTPILHAIVWVPQTKKS